MSFNKTKYLRKKVLDHVLGRASFAFPAELWLALFSADPTSSGSLTNEITQGGYSRQPLVASLSDAILETGQISNLAEIDFSAPTEDWAEITYGGIMDSATLGAGNMLYFGAATSSRLVTLGGDPFKIRIGQLVIVER